MTDQPTTDPTDPAGAPRRGRKLKVVAAALGGVVVVLAATVLVGYAVGANSLPWQQVSAGRTGAAIYGRNCAACHGPRGEGGSLSIKGPAFTPGGPLSGLTFEERVAGIARGRPLAGMPAWKFRISEEEIRKVAAYTQILSGTEPDPAVEDVR